MEQAAKLWFSKMGSLMDDYIEMGEMSPEEYLQIISSIRVTEDGIYGEA